MRGRGGRLTSLRFRKFPMVSDFGGASQPRCPKMPDSARFRLFASTRCAVETDFETKPFRSQRKPLPCVENAVFASEARSWVTEQTHRELIWRTWDGGALRSCAPPAPLPSPLPASGEREQVGTRFTARR